jgi:hypothetical protein
MGRELCQQPAGLGRWFCVTLLLRAGRPGSKLAPAASAPSKPLPTLPAKPGATLDDLLPEAFAAVREASRRVLGMRHFDSQLVRPGRGG